MARFAGVMCRRRRITLGRIEAVGTGRGFDDDAAFCTTLPLAAVTLPPRGRRPFPEPADICVPIRSKLPK